MSTCAICGRTLTNPASIAAGVGPICGSRNYLGRIQSRYGVGKGGWTSLSEWEAYNHPCISCEKFKVPPADCEEQVEAGYKVRVNQLERIFPLNAIGGYCKQLKCLVDGGKIGKEVECKGLGFSRRKSKILPKQGTLILPSGEKQLVPFR